MTNPLQIAVPWNNASYIPRNGFHPLYQALFDKGTETSVKLNVLDEPAFFEQLHDDILVNRISNEIDRYHAALTKRWDHSGIAMDFINHVSIEDLWLTSHIPGSIEFHHTSPLTTGERPFVFHCESLLPIFMPFAYQGAGFLKDVNDLKSFYGLLFASEKCLGIFSHLQVTLDQISQFFKNPKIDAKLGLTRIGVAQHVYTQLTAPRKEDIPDYPRFLFTSSAQQHPVSFKLRGGYTALLFAIRYFEAGGKGEFIFRCGRPADAELKQFGINAGLLRQLEGRQQLLWIEGFLPENEQLSLFSQSDIYLLPSINLHSVSIMQAQLAGAIPVVTDTYGTDRFVEDNQTGLILNGVRAAVWREAPAAGVACDDHSLWTFEHAKNLADQLFSRVTTLLQTPGTFSELRHRMRCYAEDEYSGKRFNTDFWTEILKIRRSVPFSRLALSGTQNLMPLLPCPGDRISTLFSSTPSPRKLMVKENLNLAVFHLKGIYWLTSTLRDFSMLSSWSPLYQAKLGGSAFKEIAVTWAPDDLDKYFLPAADAAKNNPFSFLQFKLGIKRFVLPHQRLESFLRKIYPSFQRMAAALERAIRLDDATTSSRTLVDFLARMPLLARAITTCQNKLRQLARKHVFFAALLTFLHLANMAIFIVSQLLTRAYKRCMRGFKVSRSPECRARGSKKHN